MASSNTQQAVEFDHEEFREYFLGEAIAKMLFQHSTSIQADLLNTLRKGSLPERAIKSAVRAIRRLNMVQCRNAINMLSEVALLDGRASFTHENCGSLLLGVMNGLEKLELTITRLTFPMNALCNIKLDGVTFVDCFFGPLRVDRTAITRCIFDHCQFAKLEMFPSAHIITVLFKDSHVEELAIEHGSKLFDPSFVTAQLVRLGVTIPDVVIAEPAVELEPITKQEAVVQMERVMRWFMRSTHISSNVIKLKLRPRGTAFIDLSLPVLLKEGIFLEIEHRGSGDVRHFRLGRSVVIVNRSFRRCRGSFGAFVDRVKALSLSPQ